MKPRFSFPWLLSLFFAFTCFVFAGEKSPQWSLTLSKSNPGVGEEIEVIVTARLQAGWILYSSDFQAEIGPQATQFNFSPSADYALVGPVVSVTPKRKKDKTWDTEFGYFEEHAEFRQKIKVLKAGFTVTGKIKGQLCNEHDGTCSLFEEAFPFAHK